MSKEAMQKALGVLKARDTWGSSIREGKESAIKALQDALAEQSAQREPLLREIAALSANALDDYKMIQKLMAERQPLTDEEIEACIDHVDEDGIGLFAFARAIEAAHGIKAPQPPVTQRTWVNLTKEEVNSWELPDCPTVFEFVQFIEDKIKEKTHEQPTY